MNVPFTEIPPFKCHPFYGNRRGPSHGSLRCFRRWCDAAILLSRWRDCAMSMKRCSIAQLSLHYRVIAPSTQNSMVRWWTTLPYPDSILYTLPVFSTRMKKVYILRTFLRLYEYTCMFKLLKVLFTCLMYLYNLFGLNLHNCCDEKTSVFIKKNRPRWFKKSSEFLSTKAFWAHFRREKNYIFRETRNFRESFALFRELTRNFCE